VVAVFTQEWVGARMIRGKREGVQKGGGEQETRCCKFELKMSDRRPHARASVCACTAMAMVVSQQGGV